MSIPQSSRVLFGGTGEHLSRSDDHTFASFYPTRLPCRLRILSSPDGGYSDPAERWVSKMFWTCRVKLHTTVERWTVRCVGGSPTILRIPLFYSSLCGPGKHLNGQLCPHAQYVSRENAPGNMREMSSWCDVYGNSSAKDQNMEQEAFDSISLELLNDSVLLYAVPFTSWSDVNRTSPTVTFEIETYLTSL